MENKNNSKIILTIILATLIFGGLIFYFWKIKKPVAYRQENAQNKLVEDATIQENNQDIITEEPFSEWNVYRDENIGLSFRYPKSWGSVSAKQKNNEYGLEGKMYEISFSNQKYNIPTTMLRIISFSPDWQVYEAPAPFYAVWKENESAQEFCEKFAALTTLNQGCERFNQNILTLNYAYYEEQGMFGSGEELVFNRRAFIDLKDETFKGLFLDLYLSQITDSNYPDMSLEQIKTFAENNITKEISDNQKRIDIFNKFLLSFSVF